MSTDTEKDLETWKWFREDFPEMADAIEARERMILAEVAKRHNQSMHLMKMEARRVSRVGLIKLAITLIVGASFVSGYQYISGPSTRAECLLEGLKGTTSDRAAILINNACRAKY